MPLITTAGKDAASAEAASVITGVNGNGEEEDSGDAIFNLTELSPSFPILNPVNRFPFSRLREGQSIDSVPSQ